MSHVAHPEPGPPPAAGPLPGTVLERVLWRRWQLPALLIGVGCWVAFVLVTALVVGHAGNAIDRVMLEASPGVTNWELARLMMLGRQFGNINVMGPLAVVLTALALWKPWTRRPGVIAAAVFGSGVLVGTALKYALGQSGPPVEGGAVSDNGTALPSGHTMVATLFFGCLVAFAATYFDRSILPILAAFFEVMALGVGACQVLLRTHWLSDVVAAWLFAGGWLLLSAVVVARLLRWRDPPVAQLPVAAQEYEEQLDDGFADGEQVPLEYPADGLDTGPVWHQEPGESDEPPGGSEQSVGPRA